MLIFQGVTECLGELSIKISYQVVNPLQKDMFFLSGKCIIHHDSFEEVDASLHHFNLIYPYSCQHQGYPRYHPTWTIPFPPTNCQEYLAGANPATHLGLSHLQLVKDLDHLRNAATTWITPDFFLK